MTGKNNTTDFRASFDALSLREQAEVANRAYVLCYGLRPPLPYEADDGNNALSMAMETHLRQIDEALAFHPHKKKTMEQRYEAIT